MNSPQTLSRSASATALTRSTDVTALRCDSCALEFNLLESGGKIERAHDSEDGALFGLEILCAHCNAGNIEYQIRTGAAALLLSGTGHEVGEPAPANA
jgi:hypothetical protein